ncbi:amidohydrolase family protein [Dyadobacter bucti]|uniref:amidohydrolase family protein n=1 Tax=Dyadobacter bucti TaxID=2572203 RepID=UPI003F70F539
MIVCLRLLFIACLALIFTLPVHSQSPEKHYLLKAGLLYDSEKSVFLKDQQILIKGNLILKVGPKLDVPPNTEILDYSTATVTPGLVDAHTHILTAQGATEELAVDAVMNSSEKRVLRAVGFAKSYLDAGFTTIRDLGNSGQYLDVEVRNAIENSYITGPRMLVSGPIIGSMDGQLSNLPVKDFDRVSRMEQSMVSGVEEAKKAVKEHIVQGVDVIKILAIGGRLTLSLDEMKAIVQTAHEQRVQVTAHCDRDWAVHAAIEAGVDGVEHGYGFKDATLELMAKKGIYLVPTYSSLDYSMQFNKVLGGKYTVEELKQGLTKMPVWLEQIRKSGVMMVAGSDAYYDMKEPRGRNAKHTITGYYEFGLPAEFVLKTATANAAKALQMENQIGVIKENAFADISVFGGDMTKEFKKSLHDVKLVMKNGKIEVINK